MANPAFVFTGILAFAVFLVAESEVYQFGPAETGVIGIRWRCAAAHSLFVDLCHFRSRRLPLSTFATSCKSSTPCEATARRLVRKCVAKNERIIAPIDREYVVAGVLFAIYLALRLKVIPRIGGLRNSQIFLLVFLCGAISLNIGVHYRTVQRGYSVDKVLYAETLRN